MGLDRQFGQGTTYGDTKLHTARVCLAFRIGSIAMDDGEHASAFDITGEDRDSADMLPGLQDLTYSTSAKSDFGLFS
ncbi:hypothetical protein F2Q68_00027092 [Brassica cretica]|uniref:Uncharacterized protein n=1 Tax=Brassica cretica TaxID=69181 RepID=A0A8S9IBZ7_BRACR|nr:hypothetical protein F2Q68_00027092 [Brassica cretica]